MNKKIICIIVLILFFSCQISAQKKLFNKIKGKDLIKMKNARHAFLTYNYRAALNMYKEIEKNNPNNALVNYRLGETYLAMKNYYKALEEFQDAKTLDDKIDKKLYLNLGITFHRLGMLDKAQDAYETYLSQLKPKAAGKDIVSKYLKEVERAKRMIANPVNVKIVNVGEAINSKYDDYAPSITADGKTMIFTSRRPDTKGGQVDVNFDYKYFEDIYISYYDDKNKEWSVAKPIEGKLNTEGHDASLCISPDGNQIFIYRNIEGFTRSGDIFVSNKNNNGMWGTPKPLPLQINSTYFESSASLSADGKTLFFVSERKGGYGQGDIYMVKKISKHQWGEPVNLGPVINTSGDEISVFIHPDGKTLFFSSDGHEGMGGYDIYKSSYIDGKWTKPVNLGYPINSVRDDLHFILSTDNKTAYYSAIREDGYGERDIYKIDLSNYDIIKKEEKTNLSILKGIIKNQNGNIIKDINIKIFKMPNNNEIKEITTNENGEYFVILPGNNKYKLVISGENIEKKEIDIFLPKDLTKTYTLIKNITVNSFEEKD